MKIKALLMLSSSIECVTGLALIAAPGIVAKVLLSAELTVSGEAVGRVGGFGLVSMAIACWPVNEDNQTQSARALFVYNLLAACYLGYLRISGEFNSFFLLPASVLHGVLTLLFARPAWGNAIVKGPKI